MCGDDDLCCPCEPEECCNGKTALGGFAGFVGALAASILGAPTIGVAAAGVGCFFLGICAGAALESCCSPAVNDGARAPLILNPSQSSNNDRASASQTSANSSPENQESDALALKV